MYTLAFIQTPINTMVCLGTTAQFVCSATNVSFITYLVDSMTIPSLASRGVSVSAPTYRGNMITVNLTILGTPVNNNSLITCQAIVPSGTVLTSSAHLSIQGQHTCVTDGRCMRCFLCKMYHLPFTIRSSICYHWSQHYYIQWYSDQTGLGTTP